ncbi:cupredoxin domain-containing protein [Pseudalkalibacillus sp. A8]|uniref:cupredoxin domain-containing protein n=1 Tax=Pseudalkalibacillus sp. A8 TaxID=3382641 RepID=UPI0038B4D5E4
MTGKMVSMTLGMGVGLTIGLILGILYSGNLFYSTVLGVIVGITVGILSGIPLGLMAVLDGILSGTMGGMMGAMLGEMIAPEYRDAAVKIMIIIFVGMMMILCLLLQQSTNGKFMSILKNPISIILIFGLIFLSFEYTESFFSAGPELNNQGQHHDDNETKHSKTILIKANEYNFSPVDIKIEKGQSISILFENIGEVEHDFEIVGLEADTSPYGHHHSQQANPVHVHAKPGEEKNFLFTPLESGTFRFICTIPGHEESGMSGTIEVF